MVRDSLTILFPYIFELDDYFKKRLLRLDTMTVFKEFACKRALDQFESLTSGDDYKCRIDSVVTKINRFGTRYLEIYLTYVDCEGCEYEGLQFKIFFIELVTPNTIAGLITPVRPDDFENSPEGKQFAEYLVSVIQQF